MMPEGKRQSSISIADEQLKLEQVVATEVLSSHFEIVVDVIAQTEVDLLPHLGKPVNVATWDDDEFQRHFNGILTEAAFDKESNSGCHYKLTLRPWSWILDQNRDFAIFQELSTIEIIQKIFADAGINDAEFSISRTYQKRTYCVQYGESDHAFIARLMEDEGIYYFWRHEESRHVMVICDSGSAHPAATPASLTYKPTSQTVFQAGSAERAAAKKAVQLFIERVATNARGKITLRDYDFENPERPVEAVREGKSDHPNDGQEYYVYPGGYVTKSVGEQIGQGLLEAMRHNRRTMTGQSQATSLAIGTKVTITDHFADSLNGEFLVTRTYHSITSEAHRSGKKVEEDGFNVRFEAIPADTVFRPPAAAPRPIVQGLESAIVTGPDGEEIFTDEYGRIKVRFHWDRDATPGEKSTCWIRVSQTGGLGNVILPRIGQEVLVSFLGGDPDRPVVTGVVFNRSTMPVYALPENKTRALWRTKTYKKDSSQDYGGKKIEEGRKPANEIRFEDKTGAEEMYIFAEKDMNTRVRHQETHHVGHDQTIDVGHNRTETVDNDEIVTIKNNQEHTVNGNRKATVDGNEDTTVKGNQSLTVKGNQTTKIDGNWDVTVMGKMTLNVTQSIEITCGGSTIKLDPMTIDAKTMNFGANGSMTAKVEGGLKTDVTAGAMLTAKGGMVMIN